MFEGFYVHNQTPSMGGLFF
ncbi:hypothetical protein [Marinobacter sp. AC-23]